jgi:hypothetical protein
MSEKRERERERKEREREGERSKRGEKKGAIKERER